MNSPGRRPSSRIRGTDVLGRLRGLFLNHVSSRWLDSETSAFYPQIGEQERALEQLGTDAEGQFVTIGAALQEQAARTAGLAREGEQLVALAAGTGDDRDAIGAALQLAQTTLDSLEACGAQTRELLARLGGYYERTSRLLKEEAQVERILAPLRVIQTFFRIESVRLPPEMQAGFQALSSEIPKFEHQVRETFGRHAEALAITQQKIESATAHLREQSDSQHNTVVADRARLAVTLENVSREAAETAQRNARLADLIREIDSEAQSLVVGIQYQDITRQKMEHVREALHSLPASAGTAQTRHDRLTAAAGARQTCRLQALQCDAIREELDGALAAISSGSQRIRERLARIESEGWSHAQSQAVASAATERVAILETVLREIQGLVAPASENAAEAVRVIDSFGTVAADVATTARAMAESMRLIALNAQVLAAQAGQEGAGLLVLAERTYGISDEIRRITESIGREFEEASAHLIAVREQRDQLERHARECRDAFDSAGPASLQRLGAYRQQTIAVLDTIMSGLAELDRHSVAMADAAECRDEFGQTLGQIQAALAGIGAVRDPVRPLLQSAPESAAVLAHLTKRYTMDSERAVHVEACRAAGMLEPAPAVVAAEPRPAGVAAASPPFGDNVELF